MKRYLTILAVLAIAAITASAEMEKVDYSFSTSGTNGITTNSVTYVLRGQIEGVYVDMSTTPARTGTVTVASSEQTILTKAFSADTYVPVRAQVYGTTGSALAWTIANDIATNSLPLYAPIAVAGPVTVTVVHGADTNATTSYKVSVLFSK